VVGYSAQPYPGPFRRQAPSQGKPRVRASPDTPECERFDRLWFTDYTLRMFELKQTDVFRTWFAALRDERAVAAIASRLDRLAFGHTGDVKPVGKGVSELRIHYGPGYRVYYKRRGAAIYLLLCGGSKASQARDIQAALQLADEWSEHDQETERLRPGAAPEV